MVKKRAKWGSHKPLYTKAGITSSQFGDILSCRISAKYNVAKIIAEETGSPIDLWVCGGSGNSKNRREVVEFWTKSSVKTTEAWRGQAGQGKARQGVATNYKAKK